MDSLQDTAGAILGGIADVYMVGAAYVYPYKTIVFLAILLGLVIGRVIEANIIKRKRTDKRDWIFSGVLLGMQFASLFIFNSWIWLTLEIIIVFAQVFYITAFDEAKDIKGIIYKSNIVYEDHSDAHATDISSEEKAQKRARDAKVKKAILFTQAKLVSHVPVFAKRYSCKLEVSLKSEEIAIVLKNLSNTYVPYAWEMSMSKNQKYVQFTCRIKGKSKVLVPFNYELSDKLPWYAVPLGVTEITSKKAMDNSPHVWLLDDPKKESHEIAELKDINTLQPTPHLAITGSTGGGKSITLMVVLAHFINKAKKANHQVELYLADGKSMGFMPYRKLKEVKSVTTTLEDLAAQTEEFKNEMMHTQNIFGIEDMDQGLPLDNHVNLKKSVLLNGHLFLNDEVFEYKDKNGNIKKDKAVNLVGRDDIAEINIPKFTPEPEEDDRARGFYERRF